MLSRILQAGGGKLFPIRQLGAAAKAANDFSWVSQEIHDFLKIVDGGVFLTTVHSDCLWCKKFRQEEMKHRGEMPFLRYSQGKVISMARSGFSNGNSRILIAGGVIQIAGKKIKGIEISTQNQLPWLTEFSDSFRIADARSGPKATRSAPARMHT